MRVSDGTNGRVEEAASEGEADTVLASASDALGADASIKTLAIARVAGFEAILDFRSGQDRITLATDIVAALDLGPLSAGAFKVTSTRGAVIDADDRILSDKTTGALSDDADGAVGPGAVRPDGTRLALA